MLRRTVTFFNLLAMLMVMLITIVPHHHHHALVCFVKEVCLEDGCVNDEHTMHSDADAQENECHCVAHEEYYQSDNLRADAITAVSAPVAAIPCPVTAFIQSVSISHRVVRSFSPPPILSWRINC